VRSPYSAKLLIKGVPHEVGQGSSGLLWRQGPSLCGSTIERGSRIWLAEITEYLKSRNASDARIKEQLDRASKYLRPWLRD